MGLMPWGCLWPSEILIGELSVPGGAAIRRPSLRGICGGALKPVTWTAINCVEIGSQVTSPGAESRDEGQKQLRRPICLRPAGHRVFTDSQDLFKEAV